MSIKHPTALITQLILGSYYIPWTEETELRALSL